MCTNKIMYCRSFDVDIQHHPESSTIRYKTVTPSHADFVLCAASEITYVCAWSLRYTVGSEFVESEFGDMSEKTCDVAATATGAKY